VANSPSGDSVTDRLVRVLETFTPTRTVQTTAEIGRRSGLPSSSAHRIVGELVEAGLLERDEQRRVRIGMRL
jgi:DNA-binding IclR family transcriptional regulator